MIDLSDYDFEDIVSLDRFSLDTEAERQSELYIKWAALWTESEYETNQLAEKLKLIESRLYFDLMRNYLSYDFEKKPTDKGSELFVVAQEEYQTAKEEYLKSLKITNTLKNVKTALENRKKMIEIESQLYCAGFWAKPEFNNKTVETITEMKREDRNKRTQEKVKESLAKRKRKED